MAFHDVVSAGGSAAHLQGEDVLAQIARGWISITRRDVATDCAVGDDVRAKVRCSVKRLRVKYKCVPD